MATFDVPTSLNNHIKDKLRQISAERIGAQRDNRTSIVGSLEDLGKIRAALSVIGIGSNEPEKEFEIDPEPSKHTSRLSAVSFSMKAMANLDSLAPLITGALSDQEATSADGRRGWTQIIIRESDDSGSGSMVLSYCAWLADPIKRQIEITSDDLALQDPARR